MKGASTRSLRVLIVDDSEAMCRFLQAVLDADPQLTVVGSANDPFEARSMIKQLNPDLVTLDIEMPRMDGLTFLRNLMRLHPLPVVMISSLTAAGASLTLEALEIGAVDFLVKRHPGTGAALEAYTEEIRDKVRGAGFANVTRTNGTTRTVLSNPDLIRWRSKVNAAGRLSRRLQTVVAVGTSTGGPQALKAMLNSCPCPSSAFLIVQHMPSQFLGGLAERLNASSQMNVHLAAHGTRLEAGTALVAPGSGHMVLVKADGEFYCQIDQSERGQLHVPAVDVLFDSVSRAAGARSVGVLLTGMGTDGAHGLSAMHRAGALTLVQDQASSAVWGMPGEAVALAGVDGQVSLPALGATLGYLLA